MSPTAYQTLSAIVAGSVAYLTAEQGTELHAAGMIQVNVDDKDPSNPNAFRVVATDQGRAAVASVPASPAPVGPAPVTSPGPVAAPAPPAQATQSSTIDAAAIGGIEMGVALPAVKRGGNLQPRETKYPFEELAEPQFDQASGQWLYSSFHVATDKSLNSTVSAANKRYEEVVLGADGKPEMVEVDGRELVRDAAGNAVKNAEGKKQYNKVKRTVEKTRPTRKFVVRSVGANDPRGAGQRVYRVRLED